MVFEDPSGKRWRRFRLLIAGAGLVCALILTDLLVVVLTEPRLPSLVSHPSDNGPAMTAAFSEPLNHPEITDTPVAPVAPVRPTTRPHPIDTRHPLGNAPFIRAAFVVQDDPQSVADLRQHLGQLQMVFPDWLTSFDGDGNVVKQVDSKLADLLHNESARSGLLVLPRISNTDDTGRWHADELHALFTNPNATDIFIDQLTAALTQTGAAGVNLDFEGVRAADTKAFVAWLDQVIDALHARKLVVTIDVPMFDDAFDLESIGKIADAVLLMAYDQHFATGPAGPIAGRTWFSDGLDDAVNRVDPRKLIIGLGAYGYDWKKGKREAESLSFSDAMSLAHRHEADVETDANSVNSHFIYTDDDDDKPHQVWLLDAISAWNQYRLACKANVCGIALWRTGLEEPAIWKFLGSSADQPFDPHSLTAISAPDMVSFSGAGELMRVKDVARDGVRDLSFDGEMIDFASYTTLPGAFDVERSGRDDPDKLALTFDDGPDGEWTPQILDVLAKHHVTATFFVVGSQAERFPDLLRREFAQGHLIGNHTFTHPDLRSARPAWVRIELNSTQRWIESVIGRHTMLFRAPYDTDTEPTTLEQLAPLRQVTEMGYTIVGADADSDDYEKPGVDRIVQRVLSEVDANNANIVVFHDAGGNRQQTAAALDKLIPELQDRGKELVGVNELMNQSRDAVMPVVAGSEKAIVYGSDFMMRFRSIGWKVIAVLFAITTGISILRILMLGVLVLRGWRRRSRTPTTAPFEPPVRVIIPAYKEEKVIGRTLETLLKSDYPNLAITVIDDGSPDNTAEVVEAIAKRDPRVSLIRQINLGKSHALNHGFVEAGEQYIVTIDADTIVLPQTVRELVAPLVDPSVDAVCGNVQVGNVRNLLTLFQNLEYVTSQNYDRRAFESLNCISVVPGATGGWRRSSVIAAGGYSSDTLTEDADLTLTLLSRGARIVYAPEARGITEAPQKQLDLFRQRFRWSFGTFQCLWKHRLQLGHGTVGWIALPNMFLFQILFPLLAPLGDAILLLCLFRHDFSALAAGYVAFLLMDLVGSAIAFKLDRRPTWRIWVVLIQRFYYRQFMYIVTLAAVLACCRGRRHFWNKLDRSGSVRVTASAQRPRRVAAIAG